MSADVTKLLDELDALHANAPQRAQRNLYPSAPRLQVAEDFPTDIELSWSDGGYSGVASTYEPEMAALIVAAVNKLPELTGAIRAVLDLHPRRDNPSHGCCAPPKLCDGHVPECASREHGLTWPAYPCPTVRAITAAFERPA